MTEFLTTFQNAMSEINRRAAFDPVVKDALMRYNGRQFVFQVIGDAADVFYISQEGVSLQISDYRLSDLCDTFQLPLCWGSVDCLKVHPAPLNCVSY